MSSDLEPVKFHRRQSLQSAQGQIHGVFFGSHNTRSTTVQAQQRQGAQFGLRIVMVVVKLPPRDGTNLKIRQRCPKARGISEAAKCYHRTRRHFNFIASAFVNPVLRFYARQKDRGIRVDRANLSPYTGV